MILHENQSSIIKKLFYLAISLTFLSTLVSYIILGFISGDTQSQVYQIPIRIINIAPFLICWHIFGLYVNDKRAGLWAMSTLLLVSGFHWVFLFGDGTINYLEDITCSTLIYSLPFLVFGFIHHKSWKGLFYLIPFVILYGIQMFNINYLIHLIEPFTRRMDLDGMLSLNIPLLGKTGSSITLYPFAMLVLFSEQILRFLILVKFYTFLQKGGFKDFIFKRLSLPKIDKFTFSIVFWLSRFVILSLYFALYSHVSLLFASSKISFMLSFWIISFFAGTYVLISLYRNFLTSYFVSQALTMSWRFFFLNVPIINFFIWLHLMTRKTSIQKINLPEAFEKGKKKFAYHKNDNIKSTLLLLIIIVTAIKLINMNGPQEAKLILLANGIVSVLVLIAYTYSAKTYLPLVIVTLLSMIGGTYVEVAEVYILATASLTNLVLWFAIFHFDQLIFEGEGLPANINPEISTDLNT